MIWPGSYTNGFAPRDGQPLYPSLWNGCVGAWAPCLGPTGLTLRDWGGFRRNGTLTNGPTWSTQQGKRSILFDGTDDYIACGNLNITGTKTISAWVYPTSTARGGIFGTRGGGNGAVFLINGPSAGSLRYYHTGLGDGNVAAGVPQNTWSHVAVAYADGTARFFVNGREVGSASGYSTETASTVSWIGAEDGSSIFGGGIGSVMLHNRVLTVAELKLASSRIGIEYELAPRRRLSSAVQFNRRRRLLVGAGS